MSKDFHLTADSTNISLWLNERMPLEPLGNTLSARIALRAALEELKPNSSQILLAEYFTTDTAFFDVENVLIYNIGTGSFRNSTKNGLQFLRHRSTPEPTPSGKTYQYLHKYRLIAPPKILDGYTFDFSHPKLTSNLKPHDIWWQITDANNFFDQKIKGEFSLHVDITSTTTIPNLAAIIKPFLDGIVCAMHTDSTPDAEAIRRLATKYNWSEDLIFKKLSKSNLGILGNRHILEPYRNFVKWNPADHLCSSCVVIISNGPTSKCRVTVSGSCTHNS